MWDGTTQDHYARIVVVYIYDLLFSAGLPNIRGFFRKFQHGVFLHTWLPVVAMSNDA